MNLGPEPHGRLGKAPSMVELDDGCFFACWWTITIGFWGRFMMFNYGQVALPISAWCCQMSLVGFVLAELDTTPASAKSSAELPRITPSRNRDAGTEYTPLLPQPSADNNVLEKTWAIWVQQNITKLKQPAQNLGQTLGCKSPCRNFSYPHLVARWGSLRISVDQNLCTDWPDVWWLAQFLLHYHARSPTQGGWRTPGSIQAHSAKCWCCDRRFALLAPVHAAASVTTAWEWKGNAWMLPTLG